MKLRPDYQSTHLRNVVQHYLKKKKENSKILMITLWEQP